MKDQSITTECPEYSSYVKLWKKCRDAIAGEEAVKRGKENYLPRPSGMDDNDYIGYITRAQFFNATGRTLDGLAGLIGRKPAIVDVPEGMETYLDNVDGKGHSLQQFIKSVIKDLLATGWGGVLVDMPRGDKTTSQLDAEKKGLNAYMVYYNAESCTNWEYNNDGRNQNLKYVIMREPTKVHTINKYSSETKNYWRVCEIDENGKYKQMLYNDELEPEFEVNPKSGTKEFDEIIFRFMSVDNRPKEPILLDLVNVNMSHFRKSADYENGLHWTGIPTPYERGWLPETKYDPKTGEEIPQTPMKLGGTQFLYFPPGTEQVAYLEYGGSGLSQLEKAMQTDEERMAILGARIIAQQKKGVEAAETAKIHNAAENSVLADLAEGWSADFSWLLWKYLEWSIGKEIPKETVKVRLNTDYDVSTMAPAELTALVSLWQTGGIAKSDLFRNLKEGEILEADRNMDEMNAEIEEEQKSRTTGAHQE